jgi:hypothetical protein
MLANPLPPFPHRSKPAARNKAQNVRVADPVAGTIVDGEGFCHAMQIRLERRKDGPAVVFPEAAPSPSPTSSSSNSTHGKTTPKHRASKINSTTTSSSSSSSSSSRYYSSSTNTTTEPTTSGYGTKAGEHPYAFLTVAMMDVLEAGWSDVAQSIDDPFLTREQNTELHRRLPWLMIEEMVAVCVLPPLSLHPWHPVCFLP